jgi:hypothetical protein
MTIRNVKATTNLHGDGKADRNDKLESVSLDVSNKVQNKLFVPLLLMYSESSLTLDETTPFTLISASVARACTMT